MRKIFLALILCASFVSAVSAGPGAVRCGKLLDVRGGRMLADQMVVFDDSGAITAVGTKIIVARDLICPSYAVAAFTCDNAAATSFTSGTVKIS